MPEFLRFDQIDPADTPLVGGKALSLGLMVRAGLPVPPGFCVTAAAFRRLNGQSPHRDPELTRQIGNFLSILGGGPVAVRSSATAEDGAAASFAGQQETILGVSGPAAVADAVARCWASLASERAVAYRRRQGVTDDGLAMAVVVQKLVPAEIAGVLFTRDPFDPDGRRMLVEAAWGLGESVVSGRVTPDRFQIDRATGAVLSRAVHRKVTMRTVAGEVAVAADRQDVPCLSDAGLAELAEWGRRVEALYGDARDIEWAWEGGRFWLLQARPITAAGAAEREQVRREEIAALAARAEPGGTVWGRYNLAESLPEPTPMTWAVVRRFLSGRGALGQMYRDLGFTPDRALDDEGVYDLVCGRPYCNLSREPRMQFGDLPFEHPFRRLKAAPRKALYPQPVLNPARAGWRFWMFLPFVMLRQVKLLARVLGQSRTFADDFRGSIIPRFLAQLAEEGVADLAREPAPALVERLGRVTRLAFDDFARDALKPTVFAAVFLGRLRAGLVRGLGPERTRAALGELTVGARPDPDADLANALHRLWAGEIDRECFLKGFGHRGSGEMELSRPRWDEDPTTLDRSVIAPQTAETPLVSREQVAATWERIAGEAKVRPGNRPALQAQLDRLHAYLGLRETAKHYLMKGSALVRRILVELDRRHGLDGGIFFLTPEELPRLVAGEDLSALIEARRRRRALALSLEVPPVLFSDDLEAIGRPLAIDGADSFQGVPLSAGVAEAPTLVLDEPAAPPPSGPYVLVCPSTDTAWVPLFVHAKALVMETGGVLSHGAIVAREFGLPAVAGIPGIGRRLRTGQRLRVDGGSGRVTVLP